MTQSFWKRSVGALRRTAFLYSVVTVKQESPLELDKNSCVPKHIHTWKVTERMWLAGEAQANAVTNQRLWIPLFSLFP